MVGCPCMPVFRVRHVSKLVSSRGAAFKSVLTANLSRDVSLGWNRSSAVCLCAFSSVCATLFTTACAVADSDASRVSCMCTTYRIE